ncbi:MAG: type 4a pilus biogenesis protein PilO [Pseudomonadota bacterium]
MASISFSPLIDRLKQLSLSQKILLAGLGLILGVAALTFFLFLPLWEKSNLLKEDIDREKTKLAQIVRTRAQVGRFKRELAEMDVRYQQILTMLPEAKEIPHLLRHVADLGQKQGLEFLLFKPEKENAQEYLAEIPITLNLRGNYHQIGVFFDGIRRLPRIINVKQLELGAFEIKTGQITTHCQLVTFRVLPPPPPTAKPKPKDEKKK